MRILVEQAILMTLSIAQQYLGGICAWIDYEAGDGIGLPAPGAWFNYREQQFLADYTQVSVYQDADATWPNWAPEHSQVPFSTQLTTVAPIRLELANANRDALRPEQMATRGLRYLAALTRLFQDYQPQMLGMGIAFVEPLGGRVDNSPGYFGSKEAASFAVVNYSLSVTLGESKDGEQAYTTGGGRVNLTLTIGGPRQ